MSYTHNNGYSATASGYAVGLKGSERQVITNAGAFIGTSLGMGNVYLVVNTTSSSYTDLYEQYGTATYNDGSSVLHPHT